MARVIVPFDGVPDGEVHPRPFAIGDTVEGELAQTALAAGLAEPQSAPETGHVAHLAATKPQTPATTLTDRAVALWRRLRDQLIN